MSLRKPGRKSDIDVKRYIDSFSPSICGAKWYNATIWLGSGMTTSCHHPPAHHVPVDDVIKNYKAIHNTEQKKDDRQKMQNGERPHGCQYCWRIEDMGDEHISDRVYKSVIYDDADMEYAYELPATQDVDLKTLEIAFDRTCNFACSYCNPAFSTEWVKDIKKNGAYEGLESDGRSHFTHIHDSAQLYKRDETNPYVEAFFAWWESDLKESLQELRLTGGEPLMSPHTFRLFDKFIADEPDMQFAINSNLGAKPELLDKLIEVSHKISNFQLYTSCEAFGSQAEYIRDGLDYTQWILNIHQVLTKGSIDGFHMMCTINALCLDSLTLFLDTLMSLKEKYGADYPTFTLNILRFPSFQSPLVFPDDIKSEYRQDLITWREKWKDSELLHEMELNQLDRLIEYLEVVETPHDETSFDKEKLENDFYSFYKQYDERRGKTFIETFPNLAKWYKGLKKDS